MLTTPHDTQRQSDLAQRSAPRRLSLPRLLICWLALAVVMSANGILRELALTRLVGKHSADVLSAALGVAFILFVTRRAYAPRATPGIKPLLEPGTVSIAWLGMTVAFEQLFGHYVDGKSWSELAANYELWRGKLWPLVLLSVVLAPFVWGRWLPPKR